MELQIVEQAVAAASDKTCEGKVATYIPELGEALGGRYKNAFQYSEYFQGDQPGCGSGAVRV